MSKPSHSKGIQEERILGPFIEGNIRVLIQHGRNMYCTLLQLRLQVGKTDDLELLAVT